MTLGAALGRRDNALNFVRLGLAAAVVVGHTAPLGGFGETRLGLISTVAVDGFFAISGYLIAGSRARLDLRTFLHRRAARIFPGFWVCLIVVGFGFAPVAAAVSGQGWTPLDGLRYVIGNAAFTIHEWTVGTTLTEAAYPQGWNGSLWTLGYELLCYVLAGLVLGAVQTSRQDRLWSILGVAAVASLLLAPHLVMAPNETHFQRLAAHFAAGMVAWFLRDRIHARWPTTSICAGAVLAAWVILPAGVAEPVSTLPLTYSLLALGALLPVRLGSRNDVSYGVYIYAFPVQQLMFLVAGRRLGEVGSMFAAFVLTLPLAWLSWRYVEQPFLRAADAGVGPHEDRGQGPGEGLEAEDAGQGDAGGEEAVLHGRGAPL